MIKNKNLIYAITVALILIVSFIFIWNTYSIQIQEKPVKPIKLPPPISGKCGIENCHGLDIICGPAVPDVCDTSYMAGDSCRQYASCQSVDGRCELEKSPKFDNCKSCVEKCEQDFQNDQIKFFECESKCAE